MPTTTAPQPVLDTAYFTRWLLESARLVRRDGARLTDLDAVIGDGDHGANLVRGFGAVGAAVTEARPATPGALLTLAGSTLTNTVGGASGPLFGTALRRTGKVLGDTAAPTGVELGAALGAGLRSVQKLGGAEVGDATMVDALAPAVDALTRAAEAGAPLREALDGAVRAARQGADGTAELVARRGRASYLGERSVGHQDAGANSVVLLMEALRTAVDSTDAEYADTGCGGGCGGSGCKGAGCSGTRCGGGCADAGATPAPAAAEPAAGTRGAARTETPRVGVVLVSHSKAVAESVAELSRALLGGAVSGPLAVAGGTADGSVGTSAELVLAAARQVDEGLGVAVLCDMGSAVLTLKSLVGDPASGLPGNTRIVDAPFLEGAVAITLTAAVGGDLEAVLAAAEDARSYRKV